MPFIIETIVVTMGAKIPIMATAEGFLNCSPLVDN